MEELKREIEQLKKDKNAVLMAHYYVDDDVQEIADYVGDSYYLAKMALKESKDVICFAGVKFMGESAKILNPERTVVMPDANADCAMAHMVDIRKIQEIRDQYEDLAVVCYINSTAEIKSYSDVCVTSANALKVVQALPQKNIFFIPDENLGRYIGSQLPEKNFIYNDGYCPTHKEITAQKVAKAKEMHPQAEVVVHPECTPDVTAMGDYIGSTSGIINYVTASDAKEFIVCTELGVLYELRQKNPEKTFYAAGQNQFCGDMKRITLENVRDALKDLKNQVELPEELRLNAKKALDEMLRLAE
ncbi:MAG TPA: quinolinate synthase NadA [Candidatus Anaerostipes excrementavium]|uniref:Quinolinate synthase n=1 Tax=Candidatus Anaerostipes excrementavium TaxID=2838463 RepID=A0A9D1WTN4_9FIRM|nr:quinolinate synthase NadA [uncultured Anaerostipes sp.]HIX66918.1 quinolinate synthase NadA [Candidatus Anaerostipes excrementavium]